MEFRRWSSRVIDMCGRYSRARNIEALREKLKALAPPENLDDSYNVAPTQKVTLFRMSKPPEIEETNMRWGLFANWSSAPIINARVETINSKPLFKDAFLKRRGLVPASGFFEWQKSKAKQPYYVTLKDREMLFAGLWSPGEVESCAIVTTAAPTSFAAIHDRVPLMLDESELLDWLHPATPIARLLEIIHKPMPEFVLTPVSKAVGNVKNNGSELIKPVKLESSTPLLDFT